MLCYAMLYYTILCSLASMEAECMYIYIRTESELACGHAEPSTVPGSSIYRRLYANPTSKGYLTGGRPESNGVSGLE